MRLTKYSTYIDSDIEFIPSIPINWKINRLKNLGYLQNGVSKGADYFGHGHPFISYGNVYNDNINLESISNLANSSSGEQKLYSVLEGDVFFTRTSETIDEIGIAGTCLKTIPKASFSGFVIRLRPKKNALLKEYSKFFFKAQVNRQFLSKEISLVTRASLSQSLLSNLPVLIPPISEQTLIANYLERKTTAIDKKISLLEQKMTKYQELRKSLINETVCRGLNKDVKLVDSGIKWIGQIPEHWSIKRLKDFFNLSKGVNASKYNNDFVKDVNKLGSFPVFSGQTANNGIMASINTFEYEYDKSILLVTTVGANAMHLKIIKGRFSLSQNCALMMPSFQIDLDYQYYFLSTSFLEERKKIPSIMQPSLRLEDLNKFKLIYPPINEQKLIAKYLSIQTSKIDQITINIKDQIRMLKELRKTLINDVVTGKLKVSE
ncbi:restriction endonuclease subunit S [Ancylomarina sp. DW003]|nr:restriction endonuclease subunit S [Ancylomarina sp. DW003]MDE5421085.1 restriction endonuclease subunit S [Ancylomarina sp. DW003]